MKYLLDTNACITHLRTGGKSSVSRRIDGLSRDQIFVCAPVREELIFGALRSIKRQSNLEKVHALLQAVASLPFDDKAADECAHIRHEFERHGERIELHDVMIAAVALTHNLTLVTHNVRHFSRVTSLTIEDWQAIAE